MRRRALLAACGTGLLAGCLGQNDGASTSTGNDEETPGGGASTAASTSETSTTNRASDASEQTTAPLPTDHEVDPSSFETVEENGQQVGLIPVVDAYQWHEDGVARFVDARGETQFEKSHIAGAVNSPASIDPDPGPTADWENDATIVTYCGCPHHLSVMRASQLKENGFETVYAIDEGFWEWHERGFPMEGSDVEDSPRSIEVSGSVDAAYAGEDVWVVHEPTAQREVSSVGRDGSYTMHLHFYGVDADSTVRLDTPDSSREVRLETLTDAV